MSCAIKLLTIKVQEGAVRKPRGADERGKRGRERAARE